MNSESVNSESVKLQCEVIVYDKTKKDNRYFIGDTFSSHKTYPIKEFNFWIFTDKKLNGMSKEKFAKKVVIPNIEKRLNEFYGETDLPYKYYLIACLTDTFDNKIMDNPHYNYLIGKLTDNISLNKSRKWKTLHYRNIRRLITENQHKIEKVKEYNDKISDEFILYQSKNFDVICELENGKVDYEKFDRVCNDVKNKNYQALTDSYHLIKPYKVLVEGRYSYILNDLERLNLLCYSAYKPIKSVKLRFHSLNKRMNIMNFNSSKENYDTSIPLNYLLQENIESSRTEIIRTRFKQIKANLTYDLRQNPPKNNIFNELMKNIRIIAKRRLMIIDKLSRGEYFDQEYINQINKWR